MPPAPAPGGHICPRWYFGQTGNLHLHYGGTPYCMFPPPTTRMLLPTKHCTPWPCPCDPSDPASLCEPVSLYRHQENGIDVEKPGESFFPPKAFEKYVETKGRFEDAGGETYYLRLYKVNLPAGLVPYVGKRADYIGFQVKADDTYAAYDKIKLVKTVGKRAEITLNEGPGKGEYEIVLFSGK